MMGLGTVSQLEWSRMLDELKECSDHLGSIDRRIAKYLDRVEGEITGSINQSGWRWLSNLADRSIQDDPTQKAFICDWCLIDILAPEYYIRCQHAVLCGACAPCDECGDVHSHQAGAK